MCQTWPALFRPGACLCSSESRETSFGCEIDRRKSGKGCLNRGIWVTKDNEFRRRDSGNEPLSKLAKAPRCYLCPKKDTKRDNSLET
jgi:hypothetical protein